MKRKRFYTVFCFNDYGTLVKKYLRFCTYDEIVSDIRDMIYDDFSVYKINLFVNSRTKDSSCGLKHVGTWKVPEWV